LGGVAKKTVAPSAFAGVLFVAAEKLIAHSAVRERGPSGTHYDRGHKKARRDTNTGAKPFPKQRRVLSTHKCQEEETRRRPKSTF